MRFLDNFSAGTRGATSAEYFLKNGYAVIFLHRTHSLRPFSRHYSHSLNPFLDLLEIAPSSSPNAADGSEIRVQSEQALKLLPVLKAYNKAHEEGSLLGIEFQTVNDYLWLLRNVGQEMQPLQRRGMFYLAAAVSDFFLPEDRVVSLPFNGPDIVAYLRPSTRSRARRARSRLKWTRCRRCSSHWCRSGRPKATLFRSRLVTQRLNS